MSCAQKATTCERHGIINTNAPRLLPPTSSRCWRTVPPLLCQKSLRRWRSVLLLLGFGSGGLRKQAASAFSALDCALRPKRNNAQRRQREFGGKLQTVRFLLARMHAAKIARVASTIDRRIAIEDF